jgi:hypothetical protein
MNSGVCIIAYVITVPTISPARTSRGKVSAAYWRGFAAVCPLPSSGS